MVRALSSSPSRLDKCQIVISLLPEAVQTQGGFNCSAEKPRMARGARCYSSTPLPSAQRSGECSLPEGRRGMKSTEGSGPESCVLMPNTGSASVFENITSVVPFWWKS